MDPNSLPITYEADIPESYLDAMGHMNVMWYTHLFGRATGGLFRMLGLTTDYFCTNNAGTFALEQHFRYLAEVRAGEHVVLRSRVLGRSAKIIHAIHLMSKGDKGVLAATGEFIGAHVDMNIRRTSPLPDDIAAIIDRLAAEHAAVPCDPRVTLVMKP
jgi:acyl-CoA thioesterase FadM